VTDCNVIPIDVLPLCAGLSVSEGLDYEEGWKAITINPAEIVGIADRVGSLEKGKDGDIVIWTADPMTSLMARSYMTFVDGKCVYSNEG
jgi:imidazolonepropionase-like amidohydrolase